MKELVAFMLPPATALVGMRLSGWILGKKFEAEFGLGWRLAIGLAVGMLVFSQAILLFALLGLNAAGVLAWSDLICGGVEAVLLAMKFPSAWRGLKFQPGHLWLLLLAPLVYYFWVFGRLSTLEGTLEYDANVFWVFKAKIFYLEQGKSLIALLHESNLDYAHLNYPVLVPCLYTLGYGAVGGVDEFVNKVWPFWMVLALCAGVLSLGNVAQRPRLLPVAAVVFFCFLPATIKYIRWEGGTMPMVFYTSMATMMIVRTLLLRDRVGLSLCAVLLAGCMMTKFEGAVYAGLWFWVLFFICWRRGWLKQALEWKPAMVAVACLLPYALLRLYRPLSHPDDAWSHVLLSSPATALRNFPWALFISVAGTFFSPDFFHWAANDNNVVQYAGHWTGAGGLVNDQVGVLCWIILFLFVVSFWKRNAWESTVTLVAVILAMLGILSLIVGSLPHLQNHSGTVIEMAVGASRYYFPYLTALFLGLTLVWLLDWTSSPAVTQKEGTVPSGTGKTSS